MSQAYWALLEEVIETEGTLSSAVLRVTVNTSPLDREHEISLKCSLMTALCAKIVLHHLLPSHTESRKMSLDTGCQVVTIMEQLGDSGTLIQPIRPRADAYHLPIDSGSVDFLMGAVWALTSTVFLRQHKASHESVLINREAIVAALINISRSYLRLEMTYPVMSATRNCCDEHFDPALKALMKDGLTG